jgi:hypothetical protein
MSERAASSFQSLTTSLNAEALKRRGWSSLLPSEDGTTNSYVWMLVFNTLAELNASDD